MKPERISVVVPAYNTEAWLPRSLDSLLAQTYENLEIIVVNDGSTDDTGNVLDTYAAKHPQVKVIHKENGGLSDARNAGLAIATGSYIGYVDSDDWIEPDMYEILMRIIDEQQVDIAHCGYQMVFPDGHVDYYYNTGRKELHNKIQGIEIILY